MAYTLPLLAVGDAVYALFQDATLGALATGGVWTDVPAVPSFPFLWFEVLHQNNAGGLGTWPGRGSMPGVTLRLHVFASDTATMRDAAVVMGRAVDLLFDTNQPLAVTGYTVAGARPLSEIETIPLPDEVLNGVKVHELVTNVDLIVEEP